MKIARFFAGIFACLGMLLLVGSMAFLLLNRNAPVRIRELPREAETCCEAFAQALNAGDLEAAAQQMYGQPELGAAGASADPETAAVWDAFLKSIRLEYTGKCQAAESGLFRRASVTTLDVSSVTQKLPQRTQSLMDQRIASASELGEIYDGQNRFREELVAEILHTALQQALSQDAQTVTREVTLKLVSRDGRWWVVPDQALLQALSGVA